MAGVLSRFFAYTEISTKLASVLPFAAAVFYSFLVSRTVLLRDTALFFLAMVLFDMSATMINNYFDRRERGKQGYFPRPVMLAMIYLAAVPAGLIGVFLSLGHGPVFLFAGVLCFAVGIAYTYGPAPISRSPYGEVFSGVTMGFGIPFLVMTINAPGLVRVMFENGYAVVVADLWGLAVLLLVCLPLVLCIANIMLANNICDIEADMASRYTMARHIGRKNAVRLFAALYVLAYAAIVAACALRVLPWICLLVLPTAVPVYLNVRRFRARQAKAETFVLSIKNFLVITVPYALCILAGIFLTGG